MEHKAKMENRPKTVSAERQSNKRLLTLKSFIYREKTILDSMKNMTILRNHFNTELLNNHKMEEMDTQ